MPTSPLTDRSCAEKELLDANIKALGEGLELLNRLSASHFTGCCEPVFESTIGAHFRHLLEHYMCFFNQLQSGIFCYDARARDPLLEQDIDHATVTLGEVLSQLKNFDSGYFKYGYQVSDQQAAQPVATSLDRELLFLQSHTMHHYAIIAAMTRLLEEEPEANFGVAQATRSYREQQCRLEANRQKSGDAAKPGAEPPLEQE